MMIEGGLYSETALREAKMMMMTFISDGDDARHWMGPLALARYRVLWCEKKTVKI